MSREPTEATLDPRYRSHLEAQLAQADERIKTHDSLVNRYTAEIDLLKARVSRLQPLADAATEHRHNADEATAAKKALERSSPHPRTASSALRSCSNRRSGRTPGWRTSSPPMTS